MNIAAEIGMPSDRRKNGALVGCLLLLGQGAAAEPPAVQSHASIRAAVERHVLQQRDRFDGRPELTVRGPDSRLKLSACDLPLETYDSPNGLNGGRGVVGVRCVGSKPWKIFVPVQVAVLQRVVVNRRPLVKGQAIGRDDLALRLVDIAGLRRSYFTRIEDVVGLRGKRSISAGSTLHAGLLQRARLVERGAQVQIVATGEGLQVRMRGKALADGSRGDRVRVKNLNSGRIITGTVTGNGVIQVSH